MMLAMGTVRSSKHSVAVGQRFGSLVITEVGLRLPSRDPEKVGDRAVRALCDCGREKVYRVYNITGAGAQQCMFCARAANIRRADPARREVAKAAARARAAAKRPADPKQVADDELDRRFREYRLRHG